MAKIESRIYSRRMRRRDQWLRAFQLYYLVIRRDVFRRKLSVAIPYSDVIARLIPKKPLKARRLLNIIFTIVKAVALARRRHHKIHRDGDGQYIEANGEDWRQASEIANLLLAESLGAVNKQALKLLEDIRTKLGKLPTVLTVPYVCDTLGISETTARTRLKQLVEAGILDVPPGAAGGGRGNAARYLVLDATADAGTPVLLPADLSSVPTGSTKAEPFETSSNDQQPAM
jgi:hypothetical protein